MKVKLLLIAAVLLAMASLSFGQDFQISIWNTIPVLSNCTDGVLTGDPVAAGTQIQIWWDQNWATPSLAGPDPADIQPPVGNVLNGVSYNSFPMNPEDAGFDGGFYTMVAWLSMQNVPSNPHYYLKIVLPGVTLWSDDYIAQAGAGDWDADVWHCIVTGPPPCDPTPSWNWSYSGHGPMWGLGFAQCAKICVNSGPLTFEITVPPVDLTCRLCVPVVTVAAGCADCGDPQAVAGSFAPMAPPVVTVNPTNVVYTYTITPLSDGYVCVKFDQYCAATVSETSILPADNSVRISWTTLSETNLREFQILRDGSPIKDVLAEGGSTEHHYVYTDLTVVNGTTYEYVIRSVNNDGTFKDETSQSVTPSAEHAVVTKYALLQNYPNPFNPSTAIAFDLLNDTRVSLRVYNVAGQEVTTLLNEASFASGRHSVSFNASNLPSGVYLYSLKSTDGFSAARKMVLMK